ncbi:Uridylate kinase [Candidatus Jidaibacter acanthamoeba]|uniref:Uridylate kinase n=2 Tax=Candidatus Jidaibacter acanthamoebae TaxID=86105 RepID=A0A0C1QZ56_9RICK|nr:Uridylate kinase [Candidatus Jidaibacter acanthamoeba]
MMVKKYNRILLKLSGEALMGAQKFGQDPETISRICSDIKEVREAGYEICVVVGGGNICRGAEISKMGIERASADYMGMLGTVINALAIQSILESMGVYTRVQSAIPMTTICEPLIRRRAIRHMEKGRVVIFASGTGNPYFTTDSGAALRAAEMHCDAIIKGTQIDGVYSADPKLDKSATRYDRISYKDVINNDLAVMDIAAITLARENKIPILVFNLHEKGALLEVLKGKGTFTIIE